MSDWIDQLTQWTGIIAGYAWGIPSIVLLVGTGIYLTFRLRFIQFTGFKHSIELLRGKHDKTDDPGEVTHFQALATALSATVGTGNIAGVATAIIGGGPGAVFWMWITATFGMATKYASCSLAVKYRCIHPDSSVSGGPMYTLLNGLKMPKLAALFAVFALIASFGIGNLVQANSVVNGLSRVFEINDTLRLIFGIAMAILVGLVIIGGIKRIAKIASLIVPFMAVAYCLVAIIILLMNIDKLPAAVGTIFNLALNPWAAGWGAIGAAIQLGVARGVFSNEAGLGSAPMAHAAARTNEPIREGMVAMIGPFIDTIIICSMTALVIVVMGFYGDNLPTGLASADLTVHAFGQGLAGFGSAGKNIGTWVVAFGLVFFAYSTMIAWSYYGDRSAEFLFGERAVLPYRIIYIVLIVVGATVPLQLVWNFADIANMLMAAPNLISLILLAGVVKKLSDDYVQRQGLGKIKR